MKRTHTVPLGSAFASDRADARWMRRALSLAARGAGQVSPNPLVGAVVVRDGTIIGEGWHVRFGEAHAEVNALRAAGDGARGATLYVTLEPCDHTGKTPPCTQAIVHAGVARVVYAVADPNPVATGGAQRLRNAGLSVTAGVLGSAVAEQNAAFLSSARGALRPWITLKLAVSLDGAIADYTRKPDWITGPRARRAVHALRAANDAVAVGIGTALADDPALTVRHGPHPRVPPMRIVFDHHARLPLDSHLARTARETPLVLVVSPAPLDDAERERRDALETRGVTLLRSGTAAEALGALKVRGINSLLVEGGAGLASELVGTNLVDRLIIFQGSVILGGGALPAFAALPPQTVAEARRWRVIARRTLGDDTMTSYAVSEL